MRKCPRCGYVDPKAKKADEKYNAERDRTEQAAYMRAYRARKKTEAAKAAKKARTR